jgi:Cys-tRNA(Pro)/Cys-tRNA(Cys) deacylase
MKKAFPTLVDETAQLFDRMAISGGRRGLSLILSPEDLRRFCSAAYADIIRI